MYYSENEARKLVIEAGLRLLENKLIARTWGNISARISKDEFIITPSGKAYDRLTPDDLVKVRVSDCSYSGNVKPSSEKGVHAAAYALRSHVGFIIHTHQYYASAVAAECRTIRKAPCAARSFSVYKYVSDVCQQETEVDGGDGEEQAVGSVEDAAVAGDQVAEILDADHALHKGFRQIADLPHGGGHEGSQHADPEGDGIESAKEQPANNARDK